MSVLVQMILQLLLLVQLPLRNARLRLVETLSQTINIFYLPVLSKPWVSSCPMMDPKAP